MTSTEIANASKIMLGSTEAVKMYIGSTQVYSSWTPDANGHSYVDLGLPSGTLWATMNIGANSESDYGNYYQYGKGAAQYATTSGDSDYSGTEDPLNLSYDTARQVWGGSWHMPTKAQCQELLDQCTWTWTTSGGINGCRVSKNGKSIFLPAAGYWGNNNLYNVSYNGCYWSSTPIDTVYSYTLEFSDDGQEVCDNTIHYAGYTVRGVIDRSSSGNEVLHDYSQDYFTIESTLDSNTITAVKSNSARNPTIYYSLDDGNTWNNQTLTSGTITFGTINTGDKIIFKSNTDTFATAWDKYIKFGGNKQFKVYGNIMSLTNGDNFTSNSSFQTNSSNVFCGLFYGITTIIDASNLILPATTLVTSCYNGMFRGCTNLVNGPKLLPALNVPQDGYSSMFESCVKLVEGPEILATSVSGTGALNRMFCMNRSSKVTAAMTKSPILRITNPLAQNNTYLLLFCGNGNINEITILALGTNLSFTNWLTNTNSNGGVIRKLSTTTLTSGNNGVPSNWTTETYTQS